MITKSKIKKALALAEKSHHLFEKEVLGGVFDKKWAMWYTAFVLGKLPELKNIVKLYNLIEDAAKRHKKHKDVDWIEFYAEYIVKRLS